MSFAKIVYIFDSGNIICIFWRCIASILKFF